MNKRLSYLEIQKLLQEYNFLLTDDQYKKEVISINRSEFMKKVWEIKGISPDGDETKELDKKDQNIKEEKIDPSTIELKVKIKIKKLYREIAKITHPDKTNSEEFSGLYIKATKAAEEFDLFALYGICAQLNIVYSFDDEDKNVLKKHVFEKRKMLEAIEKSYIWLYIHAEDDRMKEELIKLFIKATE